MSRSEDVSHLREGNLFLEQGAHLPMKVGGPIRGFELTSDPVTSGWQVRQKVVVGDSKEPVLPLSAGLNIAFHSDISLMSEPGNTAPYILFFWCHLGAIHAPRVCWGGTRPPL